jgi:hypothetical protein
VTKIRESLSADRINLIIADEFYHRIPLLPVVPYALSLSLGVAYRELRRSKVPMYRTRAKAALRTNCTLLGELGDLFWSAGVMARMGEQVLEEMERAIDSIAHVRQQDVRQQDERLREARLNENGGAVEHSRPNGTIEAAGENIGYFDGKMFDPLPELDVFEHFDPNFDLDAVDAALGATLDVRISLNHGQWGQLIGY